MNELSEAQVHCPYCGEPIEVLLDASEGSQSYTEDCQVCCCPIVFELFVDNEDFLSVTAKREDE